MTHGPWTTFHWLGSKRRKLFLLIARFHKPETAASLDLRDVQATGASKMRLRCILAFRWIDDYCKTEVASMKMRGQVVESKICVWSIMSAQKLCDYKTAYKHTDRPSAPCHALRTFPHAAPCSPLHHQCAAKLPHCRCLHSSSGGARRPNSARCLRTPRCCGGKAPHRACNAPASQISRQRAP